MEKRTTLCLAVLLLAALVPARGDEPDADRRFAKLAQAFDEVEKSAIWDEIKVRRDLVNKLGEVKHPGAVKILYEVFTEDREQVCRIPAMIGLGKQGNVKALKAMTFAAVRDRNEVYRMCLPLAFAEVEDGSEIGPWLAKSLLDRKRDEILRAAVIQSLGLLETSEAYEEVLEVLEEEERDRIRYEALLAAARIGGPQAFDPLVPWLSSESRMLREGAVLALGETGRPGAVETVLPLAEDVAPRVQEAVAEVAAAAKSEAALPALVNLLRTGRLRVMDSARKALATITGQDLGLDPGVWEKWLADRQQGAPEPEPATSVATYYGMNVLSDRVLFILDVSGSMNAGSPTRIETAREELAKTLDELNERTWFNVVAFSGQPVWWQEEEVQATEENVAAAKEFVTDLGAGGGTNVYDTFAEAFEKNRRMDTIFFLGDGSPSLGTYTEQEEILARLRWMNRARKVRIHTIALLRGEVNRFGGRMGPGLGRGRSVSGERAYDEEEAARFLARMASEHGGTFVKIEK